MDGKSNGLAPWVRGPRHGTLTCYLVPMLELRAEATRGGLPESVHRISAAVVDPAGHLIARSGDPNLRTFWRSAAKPFQALPLVADGAADRFGLTDADVALACASHSSEPGHVALAEEMLRKVGRTEADLACGPHVPLSPVMAATVAREGILMSPAWSNCSGKHAANAGRFAASRVADPGVRAAGTPASAADPARRCRAGAASPSNRSASG